MKAPTAPAALPLGALNRPVTFTEHTRLPLEAIHYTLPSNPTWDYPLGKGPAPSMVSGHPCADGLLGLPHPLQQVRAGARSDNTPVQGVPSKSVHPLDDR